MVLAAQAAQQGGGFGGMLIMLVALFAIMWFFMIIFQEVGATTMALGALNEGDCLHDFVGPLGKASELEGLKKVAVVGGGLGCAVQMRIQTAC